jgi:hypothetical protein
MSTTAHTNDFSELIESYLDADMKAAIQDAFDRAIEQAVAEAENKRDEVVASTLLKLSKHMKVVASNLLKLSKHMSIQDMSTALRIEISKPDKDL